MFDGELIIPDQPFDALQLRLHPAASRVQKLSREHPAQIVVFDLLTDEQGHALLDRPFRERRAALEDAFKRIGKTSSFVLSKATTSPDTARKWLKRVGHGLDGIVAKRLELPYRPGERVMQKFKLWKTVDCVVGGIYYKPNTTSVEYLLMGLDRRCRPPELYRPVRRWRQRTPNRQTTEAAHWRLRLHGQRSRRKELLVARART